MKLKSKAKKKPEKGGSNSWPVAYKLAAMGTLVAYTAIGTRTVGVAYAQTAPRVSGTESSGTPGQSSDLTVRRFDIKPGPLDTVLGAFETAAELHVQVEKEGIRNIASPGVSGLYTVEQALQKLLANTGVVYRFSGPKEVSLGLQAASAYVDVLGRTSPASPKYTEPLRDTPQSITVIPQSVMEQQGAMTLTDALRNVPGITMTAGEGGVPAGDNLTLRGFSARNDIFVDGVRDIGVQSRETFNLEQVEVVKGPQSAFTGRGSTGGTINMVTKTPNLNRYFGGSATFGTTDTKRGTIDVNLPLGRIGLGERTAFRLNGLAYDAGVAGRDVVNNNRWGVAPSLAMGLGTPTRLTLSYYKLKQDNIPDYGIPWVPATNNALADYRDRPAPVPRETFYGLRSRDYERMNSDMATIRFEHDATDNVNFRTQLRYGRSTRDSLTTPPRFLNANSTDINREARSWITADRVWDNQTDLRARFSTAGIEHSLVFGFNLANETNVRKSRTTVGSSVTSMLDPNADDAFIGTNTINPNIGDVTGATQAVYAFDTIKLGKHLEAVGGARFERFNVNGYAQNTHLRIKRVDTMTGVRGALVYKPVDPGSFYVSYGTSFNPSLEGLSYGTVDQNIAPEKTYTLEAGTKWDVLKNRLLLSGAVFQVEKTNARTPGATPDDPPIILDGKQRVRGFEVSATGGITRNWKIFGGYTYLASKITDSNNPLELGRQFINTPKNSFSVWTTYQVKKLTVGVGPRFIGKRYGNNTNTRFVDNYWTVDAMAMYPVARFLDLRLNLYNLNDAYYFDRLGGGHLIPGAGRNVLVSTNFRF